jgi:hypothetical protein
VRTSPITEEIFIEKFIIYYDEQVINFTPEKPVSISNNGQSTVIVIDKNEAIDFDSSAQANLQVQ